MQLFERFCTTFFTHNAPLVSDGGYYSSEDVFTALPYAKGRRYFDAVALVLGAGLFFCRDFCVSLQVKQTIRKCSGNLRTE